MASTPDAILPAGSLKEQGWDSEMFQNRDMSRRAGDLLCGEQDRDGWPHRELTFTEIPRWVEPETGGSKGCRGMERGLVEI